MPTVRGPDAPGMPKAGTPASEVVKNRGGHSSAVVTGAGHKSAISQVAESKEQKDAEKRMPIGLQSNPEAAVSENKRRGSLEKPKAAGRGKTAEEQVKQQGAHSTSSGPAAGSEERGAKKGKKK
jgi:hypothetical protein